MSFSGIYALTSNPLDNLTLATFLNAELGFLGVVVYTLVHTPLLMRMPSSAGTLFLEITFSFF